VSADDDARVPIPKFTSFRGTLVWFRRPHLGLAASYDADF
jgi:hypothetical protein